jgi:hypothetical protein
MDPASLRGEKILSIMDLTLKVGSELKSGLNIKTLTSVNAIIA